MLFSCMITSDLVVTVPAKRPIKPIYITQFLALIDDIGE